MKKIILITLSLFFCFNTLHAKQTKWIYEKPYIDGIGHIKMAVLKSWITFSPVMAIRNYPAEGKSVVIALITGMLGNRHAVYTGMADTIKVFYNGKIHESEASFFAVSYSLDRKFMLISPNDVRKFLDSLKTAELLAIEISTTEGTYFIHYDSTGFDEKIIEWEK